MEQKEKKTKESTMELALQEIPSGRISPGKEKACDQEQWCPLFALNFVISSRSSSSYQLLQNMPLSCIVFFSAISK